MLRSLPEEATVSNAVDRCFESLVALHFAGIDRFSPVNTFLLNAGVGPHVAEFIIIVALLLMLLICVPRGAVSVRIACAPRW